ncbi:MAG TPA: hypothetical protein VIX84_03440 [Acidimicrobiales bacterium]
MTPSKVRRTAVVAVDGVLAVGTGALAGLFAAGGGMASGTAPSPGWGALQSPAPSGLNAPASNPNESFNTDGCASAVSCVAAGVYEDGSANTHGLLSALSRGSWSSVEAPLPSDANADPQPQFFSTSCPADGSCVVVGGYDNMSGPRTNGLIETWVGGVWTDTEAPTPPDALLPANAETWLKSVSCPAPGDCTAVGSYAAGIGHRTGLIETLSGGQWTAQPAPQVSDANTNQFVRLAGVSCSSPGNCVADGEYNTNAGGGGIELLTESGGVWTPSVAPLPSDATTGSSQVAQVNPFIDGSGQALACAGSQCLIPGYYASSNGLAPLLVHGSGTTWTALTAQLPSNAQTTPGSEEAILDGASCGFDGGCVAVGDYLTNPFGFRALVESVSPSGRVTGQEAPQPADQASGTHVSAALQSISCISSTDCTAVGNYANDSNSGNPVALIDTLSGSTWNAQSPVPGNAAHGAAAGSRLFGVDCSGRGACLAAGEFTDPGNQFGLLDTYTPPEGYWLDAADGGVFAFPNAMFHGSMGGQHLNAPIVGMAPTPGGGGYWLVASDGGVFTFGNATFYGSTGNLHLNKPIVGMAATPDGRGYWLVASDGGIFNYGDAGFQGSSGNIHLNKPIVGMAPTASGLGYWLVASDGGIFTYGDGVFYGSTGGIALNKPVVGMAANVTGNGYWLVASDGGIFSFGDALFHGSSGNLHLNKPVVGMMPTFDGGGYWLVATDGGIFSYGDTSFQGSTGNLTLVSPVVGGAPT